MSKQCGVRRYRNGVWETLDDTVSREEPFSVAWSWPDAGRCGTATLWAWPGPDRPALRELALGHVLSECLQKADGLQAQVSDTAEGFRVALSTAALLPGMPTTELDPERVLARMDAFMGLKGLWDGTGCFHRAGIWLPGPQDAAASLQVAEDIGRHNCLDRLLGFAVNHGLTLRGQTLFITARVTASLYTKARRLGFGCIISRSAVSLHSVEAAERDNVRLIGFCRPKEHRFTVYA